jgi:hypothetical protein
MLLLLKLTVCTYKIYVKNEVFPSYMFWPLTAMLGKQHLKHA